MSKRAQIYDIGLNITLSYRHGETCLVRSVYICACVLLKVIHYGMHAIFQ